MGIIHVGAFTHRSDRKDQDGRPIGEYSMMGTWIDEDQETGPWQSTLGKPTFSRGVQFHWGGATYTIEELYCEVYPWLVNLR